MADTIRAGDRFGALTVIDIDNRPHRTSSWLCRCDCGQEAYFCTSRLLNGSAKSCGCKSHADRNRQTDLTGKRFGHLLVISRSDNPRRKSKWLCRCDCGNTLEIHASGLIKGRRTSCGCSHHSSKYHHEDFTGRRFGHMTVIARSTDPRNKAMWHCVCDCGTEFDVRASDLVREHHHSCGKCKYHLTRVKESMIGKRYSHLVVIGIVEPEPNTFMLLCRCDCGEYIIAPTGQLTYGYARSCGCDLKNRPKIRKYVHRSLSSAQKLKTNDSIRYHKSSSNTGIKGIHKRSRLKLKPYEATLTCQGETHYLGNFSTLEEAVSARHAAEEKYFQPLIDQLDKDASSTPG